VKIARMIAVIAVVASATALGCVHTKSEVDVKPVDINLNITGRLEVVITDARKQEEQITGSAPKRTVRPEDIGLPASAGLVAPSGSCGAGFCPRSVRWELARRSDA